MEKTPMTDEMCMADHHIHGSEPSGVLSLMEEAVLSSAKARPSRAPIQRTVVAVAGTFEEFYEVEHARLYGTLCLVTRDASEAEDLMQEAFVRVFERWTVVRSHENPPGYLYRTAFNLHHNRRRQAMRAAHRILIAGVPADAFVQIDLRDELMMAMGALTGRQRAAVVLVDLLDYPSAEAAEMLGVRPATVRVLASQGRARLRAHLEVVDD